MTERPLDNRVALVTGAYRNLGAVTAETLARYGASVIINDLDKPDLAAHGQALLERIRAHGVRAAAITADLSRSSDVKRMCQQALAQFGRVDIIVNNAGPFNMDPYVSLEESTWDLVLNVNLKAVYMTAKYLAPQMKANGWGRIVNMCAGSAFIRNHNVYTLAKAGVQVITESLALELGPEVTVNAVSPGQIFESLPDIHAFDPTFGERYLARTPAKKLIRRAEVAEMIALFCMPSSGTITGVTIRLDGGAEIPRF
ncbi:MAG: SDR family oxidoreductase [Chloroflexi bacterium]|jgi:3-oxoacyl-[acyl-carrier protein] reductase|nr:SDR family oxidoreductase [Chloroflexota bacterium]